MVADFAEFRVRESATAAAIFAGIIYDCRTQLAQSCPSEPRSIFQTGCGNLRLS